MGLIRTAWGFCPVVLKSAAQLHSLCGVCSLASHETLLLPVGSKKFVTRSAAAIMFSFISAIRLMFRQHLRFGSMLTNYRDPAVEPEC